MEQEAGNTRKEKWRTNFADSHRQWEQEEEEEEKKKLSMKKTGRRREDGTRKIAVRHPRSRNVNNISFEDNLRTSSPTAHDSHRQLGSGVGPR